uniref:Uncharacterized protein n=1 Tax=Chromera velia CCMP2878 TaxID=1169474 RepID=A0A0G4HTK6_9ALVE|eukprot:Cvel_31460.t1-p1 / transcript=Cvel_31460.t1 / gene=Cvel_31460 / organism=Chromera_velia_CCMP2878 / gene_product=PXMP2/4 family protein 1, putative / transcript_product=PXMP2/4 family protein 1, putative / location=Cvel_scaffold4693:574-3461(+) / protein_length=399 / sequence_SO=supercontig / SO=protein_coding / is_pseudo=false
MKALTSGAAYLLGDAIAQRLEKGRSRLIDPLRAFRSGLGGFLSHGPQCHFWMLWMESNLHFGGAWWNILVKIALDQTLFVMYMNCVYAFLIGALAGKPLTKVWRDVKGKAFHMLMEAWKFWPAIHLLTFSPLIPMDLKLLWVDVMEVIYVVLLSRAANKKPAEGGGKVKSRSTLEEAKQETLGSSIPLQAEETKEEQEEETSLGSVSSSSSSFSQGVLEREKETQTQTGEIQGEEEEEPIDAELLPPPLRAALEVHEPLQVAPPPEEKEDGGLAQAEGGQPEGLQLEGVNGTVTTVDINYYTNSGDLQREKEDGGVVQAEGGQPEGLQLEGVNGTVTPVGVDADSEDVQSEKEDGGLAQAEGGQPEGLQLEGVNGTATPVGVDADSGDVQRREREETLA